MRARVIGFSVMLVAVSLALGSASCFRREFPVRRQYVIATVRPELAAPKADGAVLSLARVRTQPQYDRKGFVYRTSDLTFTDDFYNNFYVTPATMVRTAIYEWLAASGAFRLVVDAETLAASDYVLETRLDHFYVDLRPDVERASVVAFTATLLRSGREKSAPVLMRSYEEREPVEGKGADADAAAWSVALKRALSRLEADVALAAR